MTDWKKVHHASRTYIRAQAASGLFVSAVYAIIGLLGLFLLTTGRAAETPLGLLLVAIGLVGGIYVGGQSYRDYVGDPVIMSVRVLRKQDGIAYSRAGTLRRYSLLVEISQAVRVRADGHLDAAPFARRTMLPASERLFNAVNEGETLQLACTPAGLLFATLDDLVSP